MAGREGCRRNGIPPNDAVGEGDAAGSNRRIAEVGYIRRHLFRLDGNDVGRRANRRAALCKKNVM